jgi:hypothetical protein
MILKFQESMKKWENREKVAFKREKKINIPRIWFLIDGGDFCPTSIREENYFGFLFH